MLVVNTSFAQQTKLNGFNYAPDERLLDGAHWVSAYSIDKLDKPSPLSSRNPSTEEQAVVDRAKKLFDNSSLKAIALLDGNTIVYKAFKTPANDLSKFTGYSLGKTVTSMVTGKAICEGKVTLETTAESLLPELKGTGYESVTVKDLLTMRSGIKDGSYWANGTIEAKEKIKQIQSGNAPWRDMLRVVNKRDSSVFSGPIKPGQVFEYKEIDPLVLGFMLQEAYGQRLSTVVQKKVLEEAGFAGPFELQEGKANDPYAPTIGRFTLDDWSRFAYWVKKSTQAKGCFGDYARQATAIQTDLGSNQFAGRLFKGYGYLTWIDSDGVPGSFWAWGFGGQKIAMNHRNDRILIAFSSIENNHTEVHSLYREWVGVGK